MRTALTQLVFWVGVVSFILLEGASAGTLSRASSIEACIPDGESDFIGGRSSCTFSRVVDIDSNRFPSRIPTVTCKCPGLLCSPLGDFRCHEIKERLQVIVRGDDGMLRNDTMEVTVSCVCALGRSGQAAAPGFRVVNNVKTQRDSATPFGAQAVLVR